MLTAGDALAKTLTKSQKITFWSQKNDFGYLFFWLTLWMLLAYKENASGTELSHPSIPSVWLIWS